MLYGITIYNFNGDVIFTTSTNSEYDNYKNRTNFKEVNFELKTGERIIGIRQHSDESGYGYNFNV